ncbi:GMC family oxidoreductase [Paraburkholderia acidisoli]|uniref:Alanine-phosphoribitol ligase n=1 Tax=Paraburkholderia acidisoli TaxID=2571748 RepID=A0A7Z2GMS8_9BURK|nr:GMC family oxidoreductase N-terminal domain-containing protein [Paraburkholderia acidisoli]QGZ64279.1 alanine-phosphoribitol ligase [Paraburkholderia acidisoli]
MYDYIIVGAGPAGCVLARRLSDDPSIRVLLVEAGKPDRHPYFHFPAGFAKLSAGMGSWGWSTVPQKHVDNKVFVYPQGKVLGGGSSINAQVYMRGNRADYDDWENECGCPGWAYANVLPYFKRAENNQRLCDDYHAYGGPLGVSDPIGPAPISHAYLRAAQEAGIPFNPDFNGARQEGCGFYQLTTLNAKRCSAATGYLKPVLGRPNLTVWTGALTTRIVVEGARATGIEVVKDGSSNREIVRCEREVLVTSGAIGSPRLLLLSGIGQADELRKAGVTPVHDLPGVGKNLHDHFDLYVIAECRGPFTYDKYNAPHHAAWAGLQYALFKNGPVASNLCEAGGFWFTDPASRAPDIQFHFMLGSSVERAGEKLWQECGVTLNSAIMHPRSRGTVTLANSDPAAAPLIDPNFWDDPYDKAMSIAGFRLAREIMAQPALAPYVLAERIPGPDVMTDEQIVAHAARHSKTDYHPVGTCKMGTDDMAVVDPLTLKVHGLEGLRVCDSSIMPRVVSSNTNAPTIMIGERAADMVLGKTLTAPDRPAAARRHSTDRATV